jgi:multidrug transporter EmrE-like cation transporter
MAFKHADLARVNQGVIAGLFTSGVVFTSIAFGLVYKEKIGNVTMAGMAMICAGVVCVGI